MLMSFLRVGHTHEDVDTVRERICLACVQNHTLCSGVLYRGAAGYTRAQTAMILLNSFAFELLMLCLFTQIRWINPTGTASSHIPWF